MRGPQRMRFERELYAFHEGVVSVSDRTRRLHACDSRMQASAFLVAICTHATRRLRAGATCLLLTSFLPLLLERGASIPWQETVEAGHDVCFACAALAAHICQTRRSGAGDMRRFRSELCLGFGGVGEGS